MEIKKVLNLSQEEFDKLIAAGEILGAANKSLEANEADELASSVIDLIKALQVVIGKLVK